RGSWDARYNLGLALISRQDYNRAVRELHAAVKTKPESFAAHNALGLASRSLGQLDAAADEFKESLRLNPGFADASLNLADLTLAKALRTLNQVSESLPYLRDYLRNQPNAPEGYEIAGQAYRKLGRFRDAVTALERAVAMNPQSYDARYNLGFSLSRLGHTDQ